MLRPHIEMQRIEGEKPDAEDRVALSLIEDIERSYKFEEQQLERTSRDRFKGLSLPELGALLDAYLSASDALQAVYNMPKLRDGEHEAPSDILEAEIERLGDICDEVAQEAEHRNPQSREDGFANPHFSKGGWFLTRKRGAADNYPRGWARPNLRSTVRAIRVRGWSLSQK
jgi:hypothetical protein